MTRSSSAHESGNVIFIILIAIALLAALTFAVSQGNRGSSVKVGKDRAKLFASDIVEYSESVATAVAQLRLRGCTETQISFEDPQNIGYTNGNAPANFMCHIFHPDGGGVNWRPPPQDAKDSSFNGKIEWLITADTRIQNIGTNNTNNTSTELMITVQNLSDTVCEELNKNTNIQSTAIPADDEFGVTKFTGSYGYNASLLIGETDASLRGKKAGCSYDVASDANVFYRVLIAR